MKSWLISLTLTILMIHLLPHTTCVAAPMGTAFTYQGRFNVSDSPASGAYDFEFRLFDAATAGNQIGSTVLKNDLAVSDGYFTTTLDFGSGRFTGDARWLQIAVRPGAETGAYTTLTPRHELTPTPYAINSDNDGTADYIPKFTANGLINSVLYESNGKIGIGTTTPNERLHVTTGSGNSTICVEAPLGGQAGLSLKAGVGTTNRASRIDFWNGASGSSWPQWTILNDYNQGGLNEFSILGNNPWARLVVIQQGGDIGIGTTVPVAKLDVSGTVRCVSVVQTSDQLLKADIQPLTGVLNKLNQVKAVSFRWNEKAQSLGAKVGERQIGVLAQELEQTFPELVVVPAPVTVEDLSKGYPEQMLTPEVRQQLQRDAEATHYKAVNYSQLTVVLLEAVKELKEENDALRQRIEALESKAR